MTMEQEAIKLDYQTMQKVLERLISIIQHESAQIEQMRVLHLSQFAQEKQQLEVYLLACKQLIIKHPKVLKLVPESSRSRLKALSEVFEKEMDYYHKQLRKIHKVHSLLMGMVQNSMKKKLTLPSGYTKSGVKDLSYAKEGYTPPVSLNRDC
jgi:primosomal protein N'